MFGRRTNLATRPPPRHRPRPRPALPPARGLAARPCNEAVEMVDHERALGRPASRVALLNEITGDSTWQPTFVFYMGHPTLPAHASPRRSLQSVLLEPVSPD